MRLPTPRTDALREQYKTGRRHLRDLFALAEELERELAVAEAAARGHAENAVRAVLHPPYSAQEVAK